MLFFCDQFWNESFVAIRNVSIIQLKFLNFKTQAAGVGCCLMKCEFISTTEFLSKVSIVGKKDQLSNNILASYFWKHKPFCKLCQKRHFKGYRKKKFQPHISDYIRLINLLVASAMTRRHTDLNRDISINLNWISLHQFVNTIRRHQTTQQCQKNVHMNNFFCCLSGRSDAFSMFIFTCAYERSSFQWQMNGTVFFCWNFLWEF